MKISVRRTGGFAGITEEMGSVDTASLSPAVAGEVEAAVQQSRFFDLPAESSGGVGADQFTYEVTVTDAGRRHTVVFDDESAARGTLRRVVEVVEKNTR